MDTNNSSKNLILIHENIIFSLEYFWKIKNKTTISEMISTCMTENDKEVKLSVKKNCKQFS